MKKLLLLLLLIPNLVMAEEKFVPVAEYTASNNNWQSKIYDVYYVACRCGFAYQAAYEEMQKQNIDSDAVDTSFNDKAFTILTNLVIYLEDNAEGNFHYDKSIENQMESILAFYQNEASKSYIKNNKFNGIIGKDISTCKDYESFYYGLVQRSV